MSRDNRFMSQKAMRDARFGADKLRAKTKREGRQAAITFYRCHCGHTDCGCFAVDFAHADRFPLPYVAPIRKKMKKTLYMETDSGRLKPFIS